MKKPTKKTIVQLSIFLGICILISLFAIMNQEFENKEEVVLGLGLTDITILGTAYLTYITSKSISRFMNTISVIFFLLCIGCLYSIQVLVYKKQIKQKENQWINDYTNPEDDEGTFFENMLALSCAAWFSLLLSSPLAPWRISP